MSSSTAYILEKDGEYLSFTSEKSACEYLGVKQCSVAGAWRDKCTCKGYNVIRAKSERDLYTDKRLWKIWASMHERCEREKHKYYKNYGGRGIKVCDEWSEFIPFAKWARANGYADSLSIDRIDNDGNYEPSNCRWIPMKEQHSNKRSNRIIEYKGKTYTLTQLAEYAGIKKTTMRERLNNGWSVEEAVERPVRQRKYRMWIILDKPPADMRGAE